MDGSVWKTARIMSVDVRTIVALVEDRQRHVNTGNPQATPFFKKHAMDSTSVNTPGAYNSRSFPWRPIASVYISMHQHASVHQWNFMKFYRPRVMQNFVGQWVFTFSIHGVHEAGKLENTIRSLGKDKDEKMCIWLYLFVDWLLLTLPETSHYNFWRKLTLAHGCIQMPSRSQCQGLVMVWAWHPARGGSKEDRASRTCWRPLPKCVGEFRPYSGNVRL